MRVFLATLALVLACSAGSSAAQTCVPSEIGLAAIRADPGYRSHHVAGEREVAAAVAIFNAAPPQTDIPWSAAVLVTLKQGGAIVVGFDGLLCGSLVIDERLWPSVRARILGVEG